MYRAGWVILLSGMLWFTACDASGNAGGTEVIEAENPKLPLTSAPEISLTDVLSSTSVELSLSSGSYSWTYKDGRKEQSYVACGSGPLDEGAKYPELTLPEYNRMDQVTYLLDCVNPPDQIAVRQWDRADVGEAEAVMLSEKLYDGSVIELQKDMAYEIVLTWEKEKLTERGFLGEASYMLRTK